MFNLRLHFQLIQESDIWVPINSFVKTQNNQYEHKFQTKASKYAKGCHQMLLLPHPSFLHFVSKKSETSNILCGFKMFSRNF